VHFERAIAEIPPEHLVITPLPLAGGASLVRHSHPSSPPAARGGSDAPRPVPDADTSGGEPGPTGATAEEPAPDADPHRMPDGCRPEPPGRALGFLKGQGAGHGKCTFRGFTHR
jgi:hypothetical protein